MSATITLNTTSLRAPVSATDGQINVADVSNIFYTTYGRLNGIYLYLTGLNAGEIGELVQVTSAGNLTTGGDNWLNVNRGVAGTAARAHASGNQTTVFIGQPDWFYWQDPQGAPPNAVYVQPWINVLTGGVWVPQGDETEFSASARWWARQVATPGGGDLGVRTLAASAPLTSSVTGT